MIQNLSPFIISFAIGLLIGLEREHSRPVGMHAMGVRTFILFSLSGTLVAVINNLYLTIILGSFVSMLILLAYLRATERKKVLVGITTELAAGVVFCLGYFVVSAPLLASLLGVSVLLVLVERTRLHVFARKQLKVSEIHATTVILLIALGVVPILPNHTVDPWQLFKPRLFGILVIILSIMQFGGYVAIRVLGQRMGVILMGFFGGLISSTVVFTTLPNFYREHPNMLRPTIVAAIFATIGMLIEFVVVLFVVAPSLVGTMIAPVGAMIVAGMSALLLMIGQKKQGKLLYHEHPNPLNYKSIIRLSIFLGLMLVLVAVVERYVGSEAVKVVNFLGSLFQFQSVSLATAMLYMQQGISLQAATVSLIWAIVATYVIKFVLLWTLAHNRFALFTTLFLLFMLTAGLVTFFFEYSYSTMLK